MTQRGVELITTGAISLPAAADLSADRGKGVNINSSGQVAVASVADRAVHGVLTDELGTAAGESTMVVVRPGTVVRGHAGAAVTNGDELTFDATGRFITSTATDDIVGVALAAAGAAAEIFTLLYLGYNGIQT